MSASSLCMSCRASSLVVWAQWCHQHRCMRRIAVVAVACVALRLVVVACIASHHRHHRRLWWWYDQVRGWHEMGAREPQVGQTARPGEGMARGQVHDGGCQWARRRETARPTGRGDGTRRVHESGWARQRDRPGERTARDGTMGGWTRYGANRLGRRVSMDRSGGVLFF